MKGDFSRITFDAAHHFSRVLMQQGRVTLDADPNEQADILLHYLRTLARDLIGPYGGPAGEDLGFRLKAVQDTVTKKWKLTISPGRYYVDGILCENAEDLSHGQKRSNTQGWSYDHQPDYTPLPKQDFLLDELDRSVPSETSQSYLLYLDVWERHITPIEDDRIREVALGQRDTCTRTKVIWQVKALIVPHDSKSCTAPLKTLPKLSSGKMAADLDPGQQIKDSCVISPDARYRGAENQLYRVEIHRGGSIAVSGGNVVEATDGPTFKWSRDNGSVATAWLGPDDKGLLVASSRGFSEGNWIELSDEDKDLRGEPGFLIKLASVDGNRLQVAPGTSLPTRASDLKKPKVRRWDQTENDDVTRTDGAIPLTKGNKLDWIVLEHGVRVQFSAGNYRTGDYWLIPARVASGDIEWPSTDSKADFLAPRGIEHHYAPLGRLSWKQTDSKEKDWAWHVDSCLLELNKLTTPVPEVTGLGKAAAEPPSSGPPQPQPAPTASPQPPAPATTPEPSPAPPLPGGTR